jgi:hypothetical protein
MWLRMRIGGEMRSSLFRVLRQRRFVVSPDVSEQVIGPILKGQAGTDRLCRNVGKQLRTNAA